MLKIVNHRPPASARDSTVPLLGSCVEINTPAADILCDAGVFFRADQEFAVVLAPRKKWVPGTDYPELARGSYHCLLSHGHTDHYAGLFALGPGSSASVYAGELTWRILQRTWALLGNTLADQANVRHAGVFVHAVPVEIGDCRVTPLRVRHNIPDSWAFMVECRDVRLLYAPEFMDRFWETCPWAVRDVDVVVIGYMPDVASGMACGLPGGVLPPGLGPNSLSFYVTPGENLESIEGCFVAYRGPTFVSPYVADILSLAPDGFPRIAASVPLLGARMLPDSGLVACNCAEMTGYLEDEEIFRRNPWVISNDFSLSTLARGIEDEGLGGRQVNPVRGVIERGRFVDAFESSHGSQELVRELLRYLLLFREKIGVMVTHAAGHDSLVDAFEGRIVVLNELRA